MAYVIGTAAANFLNGTSADDVIYGGDGADRINGKAGNDVLIGGLGADIFVYTPGEGFDVIADGAAGDVLRVEGYNYNFTWSTSNETDLTIWFVEDGLFERDNASGVRLLNFYGGNSISYVEGDFTVSNLGFGTDITTSRIYFTSATTGINQGNYTELLNGSAADDLIVSGGGFYDEMAGRDGNDTMISSAGQTFAFMNGSAGNDHHLGGTGRETFRGNQGDDLFDGAGGTTDVIDFRDGTEGMKVDLAITTAQFISNWEGTDVLLNIEQVQASRFNDTLLGNAADNVLVGRDGRDILNGRAGADTMEGGQDHDLYVVDNLGDVVIDIHMTVPAGDRANLGGNDRVLSYVSYTLDEMSGVERLSLAGTTGLAGTGNALNNRLDGNSAGNVLSGLGGGDQIFGFGGNDSLVGGDGNDRLLGGLGNDTLSGGAGPDRFEWDATTDSAGIGDRVTDFTQGQDKLDFATIDANAATTPFEDFSFIGTAAFSAVGQIRAFVSGSDTIIQVNSAGTLAAEMKITLAGFTGTLIAGDFVL